MKKLTLAAGAIALTLAGAPQAADSSPEMQHLQRAAQNLRETIQSLAQHDPGRDRDRAIEEARHALFDTQQAMNAVLSRPSASAGAGREEGGGDAYGVVIVPLAQARSEQIANGCWARLYENPEYGGSMLTLVGPVDVSNLKRTAAHDWNGVDSLVVGPGAHVTLYENDGFRDAAASVEPGKRVPHLRNRNDVAYLGRLESVKVACNAQRTG